MSDHGNPQTSRERETSGLCVRCLVPVALDTARCPACGAQRPEEGWIAMEGPAELALPHAVPTSGYEDQDEDAGPMEASFSPIVLELPRPGEHHSFEPPLDAGAAEVLDELEMPDFDADDYDDSSDPTGLSMQDDVPAAGRLRVRVVPAAIEQADEPDVVVAPQARPAEVAPAVLAIPVASAAADTLFAQRYPPRRGACRPWCLPHLPGRPGTHGAAGGAGCPPGPGRW